MTQESTATVTKDKIADKFEEPYMFEVFDAITSVMGPPAEASVNTFETGWEYTLESTFDAAAGVAVVMSETLAIDEDETDDEQLQEENTSDN